MFSPEVLESVSTSTPEPGAQDILVEVEAAGINYIDIYQRPGFKALASCGQSGKTCRA